MSLLKQILSPFVEFDKNKTAEPVVKSQPLVVRNDPAPLGENLTHPLVTSSAIPPAVSAPVVPLAQRATSLLPEHVKYFEKLIDDANATNPLFQGTDFKEFIDSKLDIDNITDEQTRYNTAFNILKRTGLTRQKLLDTAHEYHNIVGRDLNAFQGAHSQQYQKEVKQREQLIQQKAEQLQALSEKINTLKKEISQISEDLTQTKDKLSTTKNSFLSTGEHKQNEIQEEIRKIEQYF